MTATSLPVSDSLFSRLNASGVDYCHWKSNRRLVDGLAGETDLDLLVSGASRAAFEGALAEVDAKRVLSPRIRRFPGLEDFLAPDPSSGALIHLQVHYALVLGENRVKNHHLPIEPWLLEDCPVLEGVRVPRAERDLLIASIRALLKSDVRSFLKGVLRGAEPLPDGMAGELRWLLGRTNERAASEALADSGLGVSDELVGDLLRRVRTDRLSPSYVLRTKWRLLRELRRYQRFPTIVCSLRKVWYRVRFSRIFTLSRKVLPVSGVYLAVVGADGSGKSTLARDLERWLGWKLEVRSPYFGQPKEDLVLRNVRRLKKLVSGARRGRPASGPAAVVEGLEWLYVARRRLRLHRRAIRLKARGFVVIAERFPLREFWAMPAPMDGPRLPLESRSPLLRRLARAERRIYDRIGPPNLVLVLAGSLETLRRRKSDDIDLETHREKVQAVGRLTEERGYRVLDAELPYEQLLLEAKRAVWDAL